MKDLIFFFLLINTNVSFASRPYLEDHTLSEGKHKFCFLGDLGTGNVAQSLVASALKKESCHSIHFLGDLIYPSGIKSLDDPALENKFLKYYLPLTKIGNLPSLNLILGNHDYRGNRVAWLELAKREPKINFPNYNYLQNWSGLCLMHLDSNYYKLFILTLKAMEQSSWVSSSMDYLNNQCITTVALTHHPYKNRGRSHGNASGYMRFFHKNNIIGKFDFLISGHEHILSDEGTKKGTRMLISGAGGNFTRGEDVGYLVMEVEVKKGKMKNLEYYFHRIPNPLTK